MANVDAAVRCLTDLVEGRGMFGVGADEDLARFGNWFCAERGTGEGKNG